MFRSKVTLALVALILLVILAWFLTR